MGRHTTANQEEWEFKIGFCSAPGPDMSSSSRGLCLTVSSLGQNSLGYPPETLRREEHYSLLWKTPETLVPWLLHYQDNKLQGIGAFLGEEQG